MATNYNNCLKELAAWYVGNPRAMTQAELDSITRRHVTSKAAERQFTSYLESPFGQAQFKILLREAKHAEFLKKAKVHLQNLPATTVDDRFQIQCSLCGFLSSEKTLAEAIKTAQRAEVRHGSTEEKVTIYDLMAQRGACHLYDSRGNCLKKRPYQENLPQAIDTEIKVFVSPETGGYRVRAVDISVNKEIKTAWGYDRNTAQLKARTMADFYRDIHNQPADIEWRENSQEVPPALPLTEKLYQRGSDGYPAGADDVLKKAYGPIPVEAQPFWSDKGFVKPKQIFGWGWAPDYGVWRAYVEFPDGEKTWTSPRDYPWYETEDAYIARRLRELEAQAKSSPELKNLHFDRAAEEKKLRQEYRNRPLTENEKASIPEWWNPATTGAEPPKKTFGGKEYSLFDWAATEQEAEAELEELRSAGYLAEKSAAKEGFQIWVRKVTGAVSVPPSGYVTIAEPGATTFKFNETVSRESFERENARVRKLGEKPAKEWTGLIGSPFNGGNGNGHGILVDEEFMPAIVNKRITEVGDTILDAMPEGRYLDLRQIREAARYNYNTPNKTLLRALEQLVKTGKMLDSPATATKPHQWMLRSQPALPQKINDLPTYPSDTAYRVEIPNLGVSWRTTAADVIRFEEQELGNEMDVSPILVKELGKYSHDDVVWVTGTKEDARHYLSQGMTDRDISVIRGLKGARIIACDGDGGYLLLQPGAKPFITNSPQTTIDAPSSCQMIPAEYQYLVGLLGELPAGASFLMEAGVEAKDKKLEDVLEKLKKGVESIQNSAVFREFLSTMSKFHDYSIGNMILIMLQKPNATRVAGFNTWRDLGRWVKSGEKHIDIIAPCLPPKGEKMVEETWKCGDREYVLRGRYIYTREGTTLKLLEKFDTREAAERWLNDRGCHYESATEIKPVALAPTHFKVVYVFDVSQTDGKPLPQISAPPLTGEANEALFAKLLAHLKAADVTVSFEPMPAQDPAVKGFYFGKQIWVRPEESRAQQLKTLMHETAHYYTESVFGIPRADAETIAESVAFVVGAHFGFDTGTRSFPYVAVWSQDKKVLERNLGSIRKVSGDMIQKLDKQGNGNAVETSEISPATIAWTENDWKKRISYVKYAPKHPLKNEITKHLREIPDSLVAVDRKIKLSNGDVLYLEAWSDKCLKHLELPDRWAARQYVDDWDKIIGIIIDMGQVQLEEKSTELKGSLIEGGFYPTPNARHLYGVTWGVYRSVTLKPSLIPVAAGKYDLIPDTPEFLAWTIDDIGYRDKIDSAFLTAINRAKG